MPDRSVDVRLIRDRVDTKRDAGAEVKRLLLCVALRIVIVNAHPPAVDMVFQLIGKGRERARANLPQRGGRRIDQCACCREHGVPP